VENVIISKKVSAGYVKEFQGEFSYFQNSKNFDAGEIPQNPTKSPILGPRTPCV